MHCEIVGQPDHDNNTTTKRHHWAGPNSGQSEKGGMAQLMSTVKCYCMLEIERIWSLCQDTCRRPETGCNVAKKEKIICTSMRDIEVDTRKYERRYSRINPKLPAYKINIFLIVFILLSNFSLNKLNLIKACNFQIYDEVYTSTCESVRLNKILDRECGSPFFFKTVGKFLDGIWSSEVASP